MVLTTLIASAALAPAPLSLSVTEASLFKNGYAVVVREAPLTGDREYIIEDMPRAVLGTMWISATAGTKIESVIVTNQETSSERNVTSLEEMLSANVGKHFGIQSGRPHSRRRFTECRGQPHRHSHQHRNDCDRQRRRF